MPVLPTQDVPQGDPHVRSNMQVGAFELMILRGQEAVDFLRSDDAVREEAAVMVRDAFRNNPSYRLLFDVDSTGQTAKIQILKRFLQALTSDSILVLAFDNQAGTHDLHGGQSRKLIGLLCAAVNQAEYLNNRDIPADVMAEHARLVKPHEATRNEQVEVMDQDLRTVHETARYITPFAIAPGYQHADLGSALMEGLHREAGSEACSLHAATEDQARFYRRLGYVDTARSLLDMPDGSQLQLDLLVRPSSA